MRAFRVWSALLAMVLAGCSGPTAAPDLVPPAAVTRVTDSSPAPTSTLPALTSVSTVERDPSAPWSSITIALVGDLMLGRGVAPVVRRDPDGLFSEIRPVISGADLAAANLESPLTTRAHIALNSNALEADPAAAALVAAAGFDVMSIANNHSGDAGRASITDTVEAVAAPGMWTVGGGADAAAASAPLILETDGVTVAFLAFDVTGAGTPATASAPGIIHWDETLAEHAVAGARVRADVVIVSVHGGVEYLGEDDPVMPRIATDLAAWGADVVWGHHAHVTAPVSVIGDTVVATSLGNFLFDQGAPRTDTGTILEVMATRSGVVAYRTATTSHADRRVHFEGWDIPSGDAVALDGGWWIPVEPAEPGSSNRVEAPGGFVLGDVIVDSAIGRITDDDTPDVVVSYRHPFRRTLVNRIFPDRKWADASGRSAHLGVFDPDTLEPYWASGTMFSPVARLEACDGALAIAHDELDDPTITSTSAWTWQGFGFAILPSLPGPGAPGCADVDGDGRSDPVITHRN